MNWTETIAAICSPYSGTLPPVDAKAEAIRNAAIREYWDTPIGRYNKAFLTLVFWVKRRLGVLI